jgi:hypothetical protein
MDVTAVITKRTTIRGFDISIISLIPNLLYTIAKPFYSLLYINYISKGISISLLPANFNE